MRYNDGMSNAVRDLREAAGLSQTQLAERSGVAQPNIAAYESGRRRATAVMLERLRAAAQPLPHEALAAHRRELSELAHRFGFSNLRVFGSAARGTDTSGSDLDILATRSPGTGLLTVTAFAAEASRLLNVNVDVVTDGSLRADHEIVLTALPV